MEHDGNSKYSQVYTICPQDWISFWSVLSAEFIIVTTEQVRLYTL